jgi:radical SAM family uncharacterized protein/radical SAM-linked protein
MSIEIDKILPFITKPHRYQGLELNRYQKDKEKIDVSMALCFPDTYEIGMSHLGSLILYHGVNSQSNFLAERSYAPWVDMEEAMREEEIPLFTVESQTPVSEFDIVGFTLQSELTYTNILNMLDLANIPLFTEDREQGSPLIIAGGPCASNPEPLSLFIDAFLIGDGEDAIIEICEVVKHAKDEDWSREKTLRELSALEGIYVPSFYEANDDGGIVPRSPEIKSKIKRRFTEELKRKDFPYPPLVPVANIVHDRLMVEVMRGCTRGCRFCHAGMYYRPVRERNPQEIIDLTEKGLGASGWDEVSLVSLSTADYSMIEPLTAELNRRLSSQNITISLPSLRLDSFSVDLANSIQTGRAISLTFAPEAGTQRLRNVINKCLTDDDFQQTIEAAFSQGIKGIKLYFMIGLPTETIEDIDGIVKMIKKTDQIARSYGKHKAVTVTISPFTPKPHTPFQWEQRESNENLQEKVDFILAHVSRKITVNWHDLDTSRIEATLSRGDRKVAEVVYHAWKSGCRFDGWHQHFQNDRWLQAFETVGISPDDYTAEIPTHKPLPWDHIDILVTKAFLLKEREKAYRGETTGDCREDGCVGCGVSPAGKAMRLTPETSLEISDADDEYGRSKIPQQKTQNLQKARLKLSIGERFRYIGHLDFINLITRAMQRANIPIEYSQGYTPRPKISFGPPLPLGMTSQAEYLDLQLQYPISNPLRRLNMFFPDGIKALEYKKVFNKTKSLSAIINCGLYSVFDVAELISEDGIETLFAMDEIIIDRKRKRGTKTLDIRPFIYKILLNTPENRLDMLLALGNNGYVRPTEVLEVLFKIESIEREIESFNISRIGLFIKNDDQLLTPMDVV